MNSIISRIKSPITLLLIVNILIGLFTFRSYGLSWDEPLFYQYGDALGYAYSPSAWFSGHFDLNNSYGPSGDDHKTRGPAYLLLAREPVYLLEALGSDSASAWHLINFLFFQLGVYVFYRFSLRWIKPSAALAASAFLAWQPLLWGHAFINPKDPPFLTFFLASIYIGFEMVDSMADKMQPSLENAGYATNKFLGRSITKLQERLFIAAILLGITTSIRVLGPLAGLLIIVYAIWKLRKQFIKFIPHFLLYGALAIVVIFIMWPYLWESPFKNFFYVFQFMSDNPTQLSVLFNGQIYQANELPRRYLPTLLAITLTEPTWLLFIIGLITAAWKFKLKKLNTDQLITLALSLAWFVILLAYVLIKRPAMYDGFRHFLFILPPVFIVIGLAFESVFELIRSIWANAALTLLLLAPNIFGIIQLPPYQYTYYNSFVGGTGGAFRHYETDYWLTCYKEAVEQFDKQASSKTNLFVKREAYIAATYASPNINIQDVRGNGEAIQSGDYVLVNTRSNEDLKIFHDAPIVLSIGRAGATFCEIKKIP